MIENINVTRTTINKYGFLIEEKKIYSERLHSESICITIGDKQQQCIFFTIQRDVNDDDIYQAKLVNLAYFETCSIFNKLERGNGTILMLCAMKEYLQAVHPYVKQFVLEDFSQIECKLSNKQKKISLTNSYFVLYRKTWYEKHLNAIPQQFDEQMYQPVKDQFSNKHLFVPFDEFRREYLYDITDTELISSLQEIHNKSTTYDDFFSFIQKETLYQRCYLLTDWLQVFMDKFVRLFLVGEWKVIVDNIPCVEKVKTMKSVKRGGKTRKRKLLSNTVHILQRPNRTVEVDYT